ncbi:hypothetical protein [Nitrososphaera sp.]|uniref:hypothetical protein n=1 Tax=Nitrososphaera sp. TaxID=1971748 RepID=UPI0031726B10
MTLRKLGNPGINPGGVDKLYGEDWNRLVDALTGGIAESLIFLGPLRVGQGGTSYGKISVSNAGFDGISVENVNAGGSTWGLFVGDSGIGLGSTAGIIRKGSSGAGIGGGDTLVMLRFNTSGDLGLLSGGKLYLDNAANTGGIGGDTYITEGATNRLDFYGGGVRWLMLGYNDGIVIPSTKKLFLDDGGDSYLCEIGANQIAIVAGGTERLRVHGGNQSIEVRASDLVIDAAKRLYLDGGSDTYIRETSANVVDVYVGGVQMMQLNTTHIDINQKTLRNPKNSANTAVSGTPKTVEIDIADTPYYFLAYPTSSA